MPAPFLSSEEYDERAHRQYDRGEYDAALETLKEAIRLYPHSVELYVGLGYTRLAREEFVWAKEAFEKALILDPEHDDGMAGLGEAMLRFGKRDVALGLFDKVRRGPTGDDPELLLSMGRALYREQCYEEARGFFEGVTRNHPEDAEATAALGFTLHRLGRDRAAIRELRSALALNPAHHEARIYLAHLLYDRGDWDAALEAFAGLAPSEHWDPLAVWRLIELKRSVGGLDTSDPELVVWEARLDELEAEPDALDELLTEIEAGAADGMGPGRAAFPSQPDEAFHRVVLADGRALEGTWLDIVRQIRDQAGRSHESVAQFMRRWAEDARGRIDVVVPVDDAEGFLLAHARAGLLHIER